MDYNLKHKIINQLKNIIQLRLFEIKNEIKEMNLSKANESKSSAGDKYETSREMIQQSLNNLESQLNKYEEFQKDINRIDFNKKYNKIENGALVKTNNNLFLIGVSLGKIEIDKIICFTISLDSPIGNGLKNKKENDSIVFMNQTIHILQII